MKIELTEKGPCGAAVRIKASGKAAEAAAIKQYRTAMLM